MTSVLRQTRMLPLLACLWAVCAYSLELSQLTNQDAARGIKAALSTGASTVKIPLPPALDEIAKGMRMLGRGKDADELVAAMNQAAEQAPRPLPRSR